MANNPISEDTPPLPTGANAIGSVTVTTLPTVTVGTLPALPAGTNLIGGVSETPAASGGLSVYRNINLVATGVNIKSTAGQVYGWYLFNAAASIRYVKLYNLGTAPTVGTTVPFMTIPLPATSGANVSIAGGIAFSTGIGIGATTGVADADTGAPTANDVIVNVFYK